VSYATLWWGKQVRQESGGYFVDVTIFDNVTNDMKIAQEEIFGPVLSVITFETEVQLPVSVCMCDGQAYRTW